MFQDQNLCRYLKGWGWKVDVAKEKLINSLNWYKNCNPYNIKSKDIELHFKQQKNYMNGKDKRGRPIIWMKARFDTPEDSPGKVKIMIYQMERSARISNENQFGNDNIVWFVDCRDFSLRVSGDIQTGSMFRKDFHRLS